MEAYFIKNILYYRVLGNQPYQKPTLESNDKDLLIIALQPGTWNFLAFDHEGPKLMKKSSL